MDMNAQRRQYRRVLCSRLPIDVIEQKSIEEVGKHLQTGNLLQHSPTLWGDALHKTLRGTGSSPARGEPAWRPKFLENGMPWDAIDIESSSCWFIKLLGITKCRKNVIRAVVHKSGRKTFIEGVDYANGQVYCAQVVSHPPTSGSFWQPQSASDTRRFSRFFAQESTMHTFVWWWHGCCHWCGWFLGVLFDLCYLSRHIVAPWHIMACSHVVRPWLTTKKKRLNRNKIGS